MAKMAWRLAWPERLAVDRGAPGGRDAHRAQPVLCHRAIGDVVVAMHDQVRSHGARQSVQGGIACGMAARRLMGYQDIGALAREAVIVFRPDRSCAERMDHRSDMLLAPPGTEARKV